MRCSYCGSFTKTGECSPHIPESLAVMSIDRQSIFSIDEWCATCPSKKRGDQWKDGYSPKECAKAWFRTGSPATLGELAALWQTVPIG